MQCSWKCLVITVALILSAGCSRPRQSFPETERRQVADHYYGTLVVDDYRWLDNLADPAVQKWTDAQNAFSRAYFDKTPWLAAIRERLNQLYGAQSAEYTSLTLNK